MNKCEYMNKKQDIQNQIEILNKDYISANTHLKVGDRIECISFGSFGGYKEYECEEIRFITVDNDGEIIITYGGRIQHFKIGDSQCSYRLYDPEDYTLRNTFGEWENPIENLEINRTYRLKVKREGCTINKLYLIVKTIIDENIKKEKPRSIYGECIKYYIRNDDNNDFVEVSKDIMSKYE